jgi:hypothetical protein
MADQIFVKSHVARDLLQSAGLFKTDKLVVWEYVSNGLQYVDFAANPVVKVVLDNRKKKIVIADNGRGMDWSGLQNFFVMHGENIDRREGRAGRGRFGTGKSAAFGIADLLRITSVCKGRRSKIELCRADIERMGSEEPIPVRTIEKSASTSQMNGTVIEIEGVHLRSLDQAGIIRYIEKHLARWPKNATVLVNNHLCEFAEPPVALEMRFTPQEKLRDTLGDVELLIKVSKAPLEEDQRGVTIYSKGVWYETTLAGSAGREMSQYIFGEVDVPRLDEDKSPIAPFDLSRSMHLNPNNEIVMSIYAFIGQRVEEVRKNLVEKEKKRRADEELRKLAEQATEIAKVINEDFLEFRNEVAKAQAKAGGGWDSFNMAAGSGSETDELLFGSELPAEIISETGDIGSADGTRDGGTEPPNLGPQVIPASDESEKRGRPRGSDTQPKSHGGFRVKFDYIGSESPRAQYFRDDRTIYINLDHPQFAAAMGVRSVEDPVFRRLAYEVAFSEYSIALAHELDRKGNYIEPSQAIFAIRETLNRIARRGASLYSE